MDTTLTNLIGAIAAQVRANGNILSRSHIAATLALVAPAGQDQDIKLAAVQELLSQLGINNQTAQGEITSTLSSYGEL